MDAYGKEELLLRLKRLDEDADLLFDDDRRFRMVIVGGSALILLEAITRATLDIDALDASSELYDLMYKYDINTKVGTFINNFPYNYDDRLVPIEIPGKCIDFYTASLEDIVIAKLYSSRDKDLADITCSTVLSAINWDRLEVLATAADEAPASALNQFRYNEFLDNYRSYVGRWKPCGN